VNQRDNRLLVSNDSQYYVSIGDTIVYFIFKLLIVYYL